MSIRAEVAVVLLSLFGACSVRAGSGATGATAPGGTTGAATAGSTTGGTSGGLDAGGAPDGGHGRGDGGLDGGQPADAGVDGGLPSADAGSCGGDVPPDLDAGPGWRQIFFDDFNTDVPVGSFPGTVYGATWTVYPDGWPDTAAQQEGGQGEYYPSTVLSVAGGCLNMYLHTANGIHMVAAPLPTLPAADVTGSGGGQTYGRYTVRFRADPLVGYKTAWLLWPDSEIWPADGEIDFPEGNLEGTISANAHYASSAGGQDSFQTTATYPPWHIATTEWLPSGVTFILDGAVVGVSTTDVPPDPMHYVLQTETCIGNCQPLDSVEGNVQVDWVAIYAPVP
ncbi:MAG: glycoside hydrolase family 16 protein [Deltaproteobacteria bacterium]